MNIFVTEEFMKLANVDDSIVRQVAKELDGGLHDGVNAIYQKRVKKSLLSF